MSLGTLVALSRSEMSSLEVTSQMSVAPIVSGIIEVIPYSNDESEYINIYNGLGLGGTKVDWISSSNIMTKMLYVGYLNNKLII